MTLLEVVVSIAVSSVLISGLTSALLMTLRTTPTTEVRIDDARSTRSLSTWLAHDTTSAPGFEPAQVNGGFDVDTAPGPGNDKCGADPTTSNLLHLTWIEQGSQNLGFVANYRWRVDGGVGEIVRYSCERVGAGPYGSVRSFPLAFGLDPATPPTVTLVRDTMTGRVLSVKLRLVSIGGDDVLVETGPRNPSDYFGP